MRNAALPMPPTGRLAVTFAALAALALAAQLNLQQTFAQVRHPVTLGAANLEADPGACPSTTVPAHE